MELMFSRFDLDRLVTGDWELICGRWEQADEAGRLLKIKDGGLYVNTQDRWEHPGDGGLVLPIPFTLAQFKEFCDRHPTFEWEAIESQFTNDDGSLDEDALKELGSRSEAAAALVRGVLVGLGDDTIKALEARRKIDECRAEIADLKSLKPTTITERVLARQELDALEARLASLLDSDDALAEHQTAQQDAPGCNAAHPCQTAPARGSEKSEAVEDRQRRRSARLRELGATFKPYGEGWRTDGGRGALATLVSEEKAAGRPKNDKSDIRRDLQAAFERERQGIL